MRNLICNGLVLVLTQYKGVPETSRVLARYAQPIFQNHLQNSIIIGTTTILCLALHLQTNTVRALPKILFSQVVILEFEVSIFFGN